MQRFYPHNPFSLRFLSLYVRKLSRSLRVFVHHSRLAHHSQFVWHMHRGQCDMSHRNTSFFRSNSIAISSPSQFLSASIYKHKILFRTSSKFNPCQPPSVLYSNVLTTRVISLVNSQPDIPRVWLRQIFYMPFKANCSCFCDFSINIGISPSRCYTNVTSFSNIPALIRFFLLSSSSTTGSFCLVKTW